MLHMHTCMLSNSHVSTWLLCCCFQIQALLEYYRQLATKEKMEKERKKYTRRRSYLHFSVSGSVACQCGGAADVSLNHCQTCVELDN